MNGIQTPKSLTGCLVLSWTADLYGTLDGSTWLMNRFSSSSLSFWRDAYSFSLLPSKSRHWNLRILVHRHSRYAKLHECTYDTMIPSGWNFTSLPEGNGMMSRFVFIPAFYSFIQTRKAFLMDGDDIELERLRGKEAHSMGDPSNKNIESCNIFRHQQRWVRWSHTHTNGQHRP